jgi:hypothetical protein
MSTSANLERPCVKPTPGPHNLGLAFVVPEHHNLGQLDQATGKQRKWEYPRKIPIKPMLIGSSYPASDGTIMHAYPLPMDMEYVTIQCILVPVLAMRMRAKFMWH